MVGEDEVGIEKGSVHMFLKRVSKEEKIWRFCQSSLRSHVILLHSLQANSGVF